MPPTERAGDLVCAAGPAGGPEQLAQVHVAVTDEGPARGQRAISVHPASGLHLRVLPDRGLDVGAAWFGGSPVAWRSPVGETSALGGTWLDGWGGGLLTTCGLRNVGAPSEGHPMHGTVTRLRASDVRVSRGARPDGTLTVTVTGTLLDASAFGPVLRVERSLTVRTGSAVLEVLDVTTNLGDRPEQAPILYHVNFGAPFLGPGTHLDGRLVWTRPRDPASATRCEVPVVMGPPVDEERDDVLEHGVAAGDDGWATVRVVSPEAGVQARVGWDATTLPRLHTWRRATRGSYAMAVEPANCSVLGRAADRLDGTAPYLEPGADRHTRLSIGFSALAAY